MRLRGARMSVRKADLILRSFFCGETLNPKLSCSLTQFSYGEAWKPGTRDIIRAAA